MDMHTRVTFQLTLRLISAIIFVNCCYSNQSLSVDAGTMDPNDKQVEFSADKITVVNDNGDTKKAVCYVQNCSTVSLKIRVAISKKSDPVSLSFSLLSSYEFETCRYSVC